MFQIVGPSSSLGDEQPAAPGPERNSGLLAVIAVAHAFDIPADLHQVWHVHGKVQDAYTHSDIIRCAIRLGFKARSVVIRIAEFDNDLAPCVITHKESGEHFLVVKVVGQNIYVRCPVTGEHQLLTHAEAKKNYRAEWLIFSPRPGWRQTDTKFGFSWFLPSILKHRSQLFKILLASLAIQGFALASPMFFQAVIDKVLVSRGLSTLDVLAIGLLGIAFLDPLVTLIRSLIFAHFASCVNAELSARLYRHLIYLPLEYFGTRRVGAILARVREMDDVRNFLTGSALMMVVDLMFIGVFLSVMFHYSYKLTWIVIAAIVVFGFMWLSFSPILRKRVEKDYEFRAKNTAFMTECVTAIETIKSLGINGRVTGEWDKHLGGSLKASLRANLFGYYAGSGIELVQKISTAAILWFGVSLVLDGKLTIGQLVAFNMLSGHVTMPVLRLAQIWPDFQNAGVAVKRVGAILDTETETVVSAGRSSLERVSGKIELRKVNFRYSANGSEVLRQLSMEVEPGEIIGITGESGSGKSTITKLVQRLYVPQEGQVLVDSVDLAMVDPAMLRRRIGVVLQDSFLFNGSIYDNIALGDPLAGAKQIQHAVMLAGANEFIQRLPENYLTNVGERGSNLSGGQRQRLALARALVGNPAILILDEATSALDYESEAGILARLPEFSKGRTLVIIAHRLNCMPICDRIYVMKHGQFVEQGHHDQLVENGGEYANFWWLQNRD